MKGQEFASLLNEFAELLDDSRSSQLRRLAAVFAAAPGTAATTTVGRLERLPASGGGGWFDKSMSQTSGLLAQLQAPVKAISSKSSALADLNAVIELLEQRGSESLEAFTAAGIAALQKGPAKPARSKPATKPRKPVEGVRQELVDAYVQRLESTLGEDAFEIAVAALQKDKAARVVELKAIAKTMMGLNAKSRGEAFGLIRHRHQALMTAKAKARATDGRSAA